MLHVIESKLLKCSNACVKFNFNNKLLHAKNDSDNECGLSDNFLPPKCTNIPNIVIIDIDTL